MLERTAGDQAVDLARSNAFDALASSHDDHLAVGVQFDRLAARIVEDHAIIHRPSPADRWSS
ncbi:hypothetical protein ASF00_01020 [Sphingomonas sp. Leaf34]|uniref:hypothetical protein n=1 Tax=Sphingomonas sp. Leaf34 TaxID=1736216 RepID=UPI0006FA3915|nr:hypothetical protein [Sphingomonas sp. Leaf34]KQN31419.1 hypothetical protein ASF00_01020 [Sphingomonas sp. Leaf34]